MNLCCTFADVFLPFFALSISSFFTCSSLPLSSYFLSQMFFIIFFLLQLPLHASRKGLRVGRTHMCTHSPTHTHTHPHALTHATPLYGFLFEMHNLFLATAEKCISTPLLVSNRLRFSDPMPPKLFRRTKFRRKISEHGQVTPGLGGRLFKSCSFLCIKVLTLL